MELKEVVIVNPLTTRKIPKATPCCLVCFEQEIPQKLFVSEELECGCEFSMHDMCVEQWFAIAGREICPNCGIKWESISPCYAKFQTYLFRCCLAWSLTVIISLVAIYVYQVVTR